MKKLIFIILIILIISGCGAQNPTFIQGSYIASLKSPSFLQKSSNIYLDKYMEGTPIVLNGQIYSIIFGHGANNVMQIDNMFTNAHISTINIGTGGLGCAIVVNGTVYVFLSNNSGTTGNQVTVISSTDLINWTVPQIVFSEQGNSIYNISVCADNTGFMMAYEIGINGNSSFTHKFAHSNIINGVYTQIGGIYAADGYAACPTIRYDVQYNKYYILYLKNLGGGNFDTFIYRTSDLINWDNATGNIIPFMSLDTPGEGVNNSDVDFCEYNGQTYFLYAIGNQTTWVAVKTATAPMTNLQYLRSFYAVP